MNLQTRKLNFIQQILKVNNEKLFSKLESLLEKEHPNSDTLLKEKLTSRALKANKDIERGKVYDRSEAVTKLNEQMGK